MKDRELVLVDYVGRTDGEIFDLTDEEKAEEEGIRKENIKYDPIPVLIGENYVIEGFEEALKDMEVGEEREIEVPPEKGYGKRSGENVETYPKREFEKQDVNVRPGEEIMIGNQRGKVISVESGRVRVDFNHPLAGKDLEYELEIVEKVEGDEEKAEYIAQQVAGHFDSEVEDRVLKVEETHSHDGHEHDMPEQLKEELERQVEEYTGLEVEYV